MIKVRDISPEEKYIAEIRRIPRLDRKSQEELIKKVQNHGDKSAERKIIESYLKLVVSIAKRYANRCHLNLLDLIDLIQEGSIGLGKAIHRFDYSRNYKFSTYAVWWIKEAILKALYDNSLAIKLEYHKIILINKFKKTRWQIIQKTGKEPTIEEIAEKMGISVKKLEKNLSFAYEIKCFSFEDFIADSKETANPEKEMQRKELNEKVRQILCLLSPREEKVMRMRFGIGEKRDYNLRETGEKFNLTREAIRQIQVKGHRQLKKRHVTGIKKFKLDDYI